MRNSEVFLEQYISMYSVPHRHKPTSSNNGFYILSTIFILLGLLMIWAGLIDPDPQARDVSFFFGMPSLILGCFVLLYPQTNRYKRGLGRAIVEWEKWEKEEARAIEFLCEHLKVLGLDASVESKEHKQIKTSVEKPLDILGSVKVANRNIDLIEWQQDVFDHYHGDNFQGRWNRYRCNYVVHAKVDGLEDRLKAKSKPVFVKKGFEWKGKELAQVLNNDADITQSLYPPDKVTFMFQESVWSFDRLSTLPNVEIIPYKEHQCVRMRQAWVNEWTDRPNQKLVSAFPTIETFNAFDRIAHYIHSIANAGREKRA